MKLLINLPNKMLLDLKKITSSNTNKDAIERALKMLIDKENRKDMLKYRGKIDISIDLDVLRDRFHTNNFTK